MNSTVIEMAPESFFPGAEVSILMSSKACTRGISVEPEYFANDFNDYKKESALRRMKAVE